MQERIRNCTNPVPDKGGKDCSSLGDNSQTRTCNAIPCPGDYLYVHSLSGLNTLAILAPISTAIYKCTG